MHIYHYAAYEVNALRRLMGRYATRETEVDDLLRGEVFVDLLSITRAAVAIGTSGYSLKDIEVLFSPARKAGVTDAGSSMVEYQRWMDSGEPGDWQHSPTLTAIRDYNREDCEATWRLASWLRGLQSKAGVHYLPLETKPDQPQEARPEDALAEALLARAETEPDAERKRVTQLVGWLLNYHRREEKPMWWRYFDRLGASEEELFNDADCLAGLVRTDKEPVPIKKSLEVEYRFDPEQDTKLQEGDKVFMVTGAEPVRNTVAAFDVDHGLLTMSFGPKRVIPDRCSLIPDEWVSSESLRNAVLRFADRWQRGDMSSVQAIDDLLFSATGGRPTGGFAGRRRPTAWGSCQPRAATRSHHTLRPRSARVGQDLQCGGGDRRAVGWWRPHRSILKQPQGHPECPRRRERGSRKAERPGADCQGGGWRRPATEGHCSRSRAARDCGRGHGVGVCQARS